MTWLISNWQTVAGGLAAVLATIAGGSEAKKRGWLNWLPFMAPKVSPDTAQDDIDTAAEALLRVAKIARLHQGRDEVLEHTLDALSALLKPVKGDAK